jgi:hypothetical protein
VPLDRRSPAKHPHPARGTPPSAVATDLPGRNI